MDSSVSLNQSTTVFLASLLDHWLYHEYAEEIIIFLNMCLPLPLFSALLFGRPVPTVSFCCASSKKRKELFAIWVFLLEMLRGHPHRFFVLQVCLAGMEVCLLSVSNSSVIPSTNQDKFTNSTALRFIRPTKTLPNCNMGTSHGTFSHLLVSLQREAWIPGMSCVAVCET